MAAHSSYWTRRRKVHSNVSEHIESLQDENLQFETFHLHEQYRQSHSEENRLENDPTCNMDTLTPNQPDFDINISDAQVDSEGDLEQNESDLNSQCRFNDTYMDKSESEGETESFRDKIKEWAVLHSITNLALVDLLNILRVSHPDLPKDPRTLLRTETSYDIKKKCGGEFYYFGIEKSVVDMLYAKVESLIDGFRLDLQINIDGLPLFKSTQHQFWPILGRFINTDQKEPFIIGIFSGTSKPNDLDEYFREFLDEYNELHLNGLNLSGKVVYIDIHSVICDAPARAFIKCVKQYSGYHGCDKCIQEGEWKGKMTFPETSSPLRTDESFLNMDDEDHHKGESPLTDVNIGMVSQIPIDYMHLVCLGVMKRLLLLWIKGPLPCRLSARSVLQISSNLLSLKNCVPSDFARQPRSLSEIDRWKATEMRQFLLYTGPLVLIGVVHPNIYENFLLLSVGLHILLNNTLSRMYNQYAHDALVGFVTHFCQIYGEESAVYNVHGLIHLSEDSKNYGSLDNISSFPFETFLYKLKRLVRKPSFLLPQVIRRLSEQTNIQKVKSVYPIFKKEHRRGPLPDEFIAGTQYQVVKTKDFVLKLNKKDGCVRIGGDICLLQNIIVDDNDVYIVYKRFQTSENFFTSPLQSSLLGIVVVGGLHDDVMSVKLSGIEAKCVLLPFREKHVAIPFTDSVWSKTVYAVVEFLDDNSVAVVPNNWIIEDGKKCLWPSKFKAPKRTLAVKNAVAPSKEFVALSVRVMYKGDYNQARKRLTIADLTSDLQTETEDEDNSKRKKRPNPRFVLDDTDDTDDDEDVAVPRRKSPRKSASKKAPSPPHPPTIAPPIPQSPDYESELLIHRSRKSTPRRLVLSPTTPPRSSSPASPPTALPTLFEQRSNIGSFERKLLMVMEEVKVQVNFNTKLINAVLKKIDTGSSTIVDQAEIDGELAKLFPIQTQEEVLTFEEKLKEEDMANKMVKFLSPIGGENMKKTVRRLLAFMFSNKLAREVNWVGKGGKLAFSKLKLKDILIRAVRANRLSSDATHSDICNTVKEWFRYSCDREGGRKEREERKKQKERAQQSDDNEDTPNSR